MGLLILGVLLWSAAHLLKRLAPRVRQGWGAAGKPLMALMVLISVVLMTLGYQQASGPVWWGRQTPWVGINNLLVYLGFYVIAGSLIGARVAGVIRHPQLTALKAWAVAHLMVNGDLPSLILFGGLLAWAVIEVIVINRQDGKPPLAKPAHSLARELGAVVITLLVYAGVSYVHAFLGYPVHG